MPVANSPLRYPGGKAALTKFIASIISANGISDGVYAEPFAGGAGAALNLLYAGHVERILINDADPRIHAFWKAALTQPKRFIDRIMDTPITVDEWRKQKEIYLKPKSHSNIKLGFATFFLNRCNRSGILMKAGPIGGYEQTGKWKIDARFNREAQVERIEKLALYREHIDFHNLDATEFLGQVALPLSATEDLLVYLDPPYYEQGGSLYMNHFQHDDHAALATFIMNQQALKWFMTYDNVPQISELYQAINQVPFDLNYSASRVRIEKELLIYPDQTLVPQTPNELKAAS